MNKFNLLSVNQDAKTKKGLGSGFLTGILYLAPSEESGFQVCANASEGCKASCLYTAGRGAFSNVQRARINRTLKFFNDRENFLGDLIMDIEVLKIQAKRLGLTPCVRLNGTSDIDWQNIKLDGKSLIEIFPDIQFYDYTKFKTRSSRFQNYHLTYSRKETDTLQDIKTIMDNGTNVAIVFKTMPQEWEGFKVISGEENDIRFNDPQGVIIGLRAKGKAKQDKSGFVL